MALSQLGALVGLRWRMVRSTRVRQGLLALVLAFPLLLAQGVLLGQSFPPGKRLLDLLLLAPTVYLVFAALAVVAPLVVGGGNELFPEGQLVAYPLHPRTVFAGSVLLAPLNLAWLTQVLVLVTVTAAVAARGSRVVFALVTTTGFIAFSTVAGQAIGWTVVGVRQSLRGRAVVRGCGAVLAATALGVVATGSTSAVLDHAPTRHVVIAALLGAQGTYGEWAAVTGGLVAGTVIAFRMGQRLCGWSLRRTTPAGRPELAPVHRRPARGSHLAELVAVDRASVLRSTPLRRGVLVLAVLPGLVAMLAHPSWTSLTLLPGLVAAGAGLLFGVNAFCLDGGGAVFVAALPHPARMNLLAKVVVIGQTCLAAVVLAEALALTQVRTRPNPAEAIAVAGSVLGVTLLVAAACARLSVTRPHKADLRGPRDTPAPPTTMAVYSLRLALGTTWAGLAFAAAGASGSWPAAVAACVAVAAFAARSLLHTFASWGSPAVRANVVTTVSYG